MDQHITNIPNDSKASILTSGLLGDNYIGLTPGYSADFYKAGDRISVDDTEGAVVLEQLIKNSYQVKQVG